MHNKVEYHHESETNSNQIPVLLGVVVRVCVFAETRIPERYEGQLARKILKVVLRVSNQLTNLVGPDHNFSYAL